jgi:hypothetical protein
MAILVELPAAAPFPVVVAFKRPKTVTAVTVV